MAHLLVSIPASLHMKTCSKCNTNKRLSEFHKRESQSDGLSSECKSCHKIRHLVYYPKNKEQILKRGKEWRNKNRGRVSIYSKKYYNNIIVNEPWIKNYKAAKSRCNGKNNNRYPRYGGRGIKFNLSLEDIKNLWLRDDASKMLKPSIDRIDNDGNYTFANCRFIELSENSSKKNT